MHPPLEDLLAELDVNSEHAPANGGRQQKQRRAYRSCGEDFHISGDKLFRSDKRPMSKRIARNIALVLFAVLVSVGGTVAAQSYRDEIIEAFPPLGWLLPVSTMMAPVPSVTTADLQEQLKPLAVDLALVRHSVEQLGSNLDQLARKQDQLALNMATLQAAQQELSQKVSAPPLPPTVPSPPPRKAVHVPLPPPKSLKPSAQ